LLIYELVYIAMVRNYVSWSTSYGKFLLRHVWSGRHAV